VSPMAASGDPNASGGQFVESSDDWSGTATFTVDIPFFSGCIIWCRALSPFDKGFVHCFSHSGREDIFDLTPGTMAGSGRS